MLVEWITIIAVLLIIGILLDGWRRMRNNQRGSIKMARNLPDSGEALDDSEYYGSELPSGGARVVSVRDETADNQPAREPEQVALNLDESVPMLMDVEGSVDDIAEISYPGDLLTTEIPVNVHALPDEPCRVEPSLGDTERVDVEPVDTSASHVCEPTLKTPPPAAPDDVIVINVMARDGERFDADKLEGVLLECDMRFGDMNIYHRHEQPDGEGPVLFSMVNMIKPGTFSLSDRSSLATPGVSLFLTLPMRADAMMAFNAMITTAHELQKGLGAELKDENRSDMTIQTLEHSRERICEHQRKCKLEARAAI